MKIRQKKLKIVSVIMLLITAMFSCKKNNLLPKVPLSDIYIKQAAHNDTMSVKISAAMDSIVTIKIDLALRSVLTNGNHTASLKIDTSQLEIYNSEYGANAILLPVANYLGLFIVSNISAGKITADQSMELNIVKESALEPSTTYVLPLVIDKVDNQSPTQLEKGQVLYIVIKTAPIDYGTPISKANWSIVSYSSQAEVMDGYASYVLDNDENTAWSIFLDASTPNNGLPQDVVIDMAQQYNVKAITFQNWPLWPFGGNPTLIQIELSVDGHTWLDAGKFPGGDPSSTAHKLLIKPVLGARYIRYTILAASKISFISSFYYGVAEIGANQ